MRRLRTGKGISQTQLADLAGIDRSYISRLERMIENPSVAILDKISLALDVTTAELFVPPGEEATNPSPLRAGRPRTRSAGSAKVKGV
ncbi:helix-turn-helix transcriptional regulator [Devosia sp. SD17-2]|uniref:helix-turn-helix domain-containing protein n=1 Tax=Devosia sp. SD17-2 TaxID=2976459 RepID=UPI0023D86635|nr:helix-turn-helix transcriptional regulator [Devosia sp. SD17-2]WEJ32449.1 helix-turn-helix domain-containing protein [Devosia sp. SD17-2]